MDTPPAPPQEFRLRERLPLWWRRIPRRAAEAMFKRYQLTGQLPTTRLLSQSELEQALAPVERPPVFGIQERQSLLDTLELFDKKLHHLLRSAYPDLHLEAPHLQTMPVQVDARGVSFAARDPELQVGDVLEVQLSLQTYQAPIMRCFVRVERLQVNEKNGLVVVETRYAVAPRSNSQLWLHRLDEPHRPPPEPPPPPEPVPEKPTPPRPASPLMGGLKPPSAPSPASAKEDNRRQFYRVNDEIPLAWKVISEAEYQQLQSHFAVTRTLTTRDKVSAHLRLLRDINDRLINLEKSPKSQRLGEWFRDELDLLYRRANAQEEENLYEMLLLRLLAMLKEMTDAQRVRPKTPQYLSRLRLKLELQLKRDAMDYKTDPKDRQETLLTLKKLNRETAKLLQEYSEEEPVLSEGMRQMFDGIEKINLRNQDRHPQGIESNSTLIPYSVNLSATGVAFRTRKEMLNRGDMLELQLGLRLAEDPNQITTVLCYGKVVMMKGPDPDKRYRIATQLEIIPRKSQEYLYVHIVRKQRNRLKNRVEVDEFERFFRRDVTGAGDTPKPGAALVEGQSAQELIKAQEEKVASGPSKEVKPPVDKKP